MRRLLLISALLAMALLPAAARADGFGILGAAPSVQDPPYRYVSLVPATRPRLSVVERIDMRDGKVDRWWYLHGDYRVPAVAYDDTAGGLSADGGTLVLARAPHAYAPKETRFAVLDTRLFLRHPNRPQGSPRHAISHIRLKGAFSFDAISPDGSRIYLVHNFYSDRRLTHYEVRALDTGTGGLLPAPIVDRHEPDERMEGSPVARVSSPGGRWAYTLYSAKTPFLHALDTVRGRAVCVDLPQLRSRREPFTARLKLSRGGHVLTVYSQSVVGGRLHLRPRLEIDTSSFRVTRADADATASGDAAKAADIPWPAIAVAGAALLSALLWRRRLGSR